MANANEPGGFRPVQTRNGAPWAGKTIRVAFAAGDAVPAFVGQMVKYTGASADGGKTPVVEVADPADTRLAGAIVRFEFDPDNLTLLHRPTLTFRYAWLPADRDVLYWIQEDSDAGALTSGAVEANIDFIGISGSTITGASSTQLDSSTVLTTAALPLRIVRLDGADDNEIGVNAKWLVTINQDA